jgi:hypothetical protein
MELTAFEIGAGLVFAGIAYMLYFRIAPKYKNIDKNTRLGMNFLLFLVSLIGGIIMLIAEPIFEWI